MVISFLTRVLDDMDRHPLEEEDERAAVAELVPPLFKVRPGQGSGGSAVGLSCMRSVQPRQRHACRPLLVAGQLARQDQHLPHGGSV